MSLSAAFAEASPSLLSPPPPKVFAEISTQTEIESVLAVAVPVPTYTGATLFQFGLIKHKDHHNALAREIFIRIGGVEGVT